MGVNSLPKTVTRQRRGCDFNPGPTAPESSMLTTRLPSHNATTYLLARPAAAFQAYVLPLFFIFLKLLNDFCRQTDYLNVYNEPVL